MLAVHVRHETPDDYATVINITDRAFKPMPFAAGDEHLLTAKLRDHGALRLSLVAVLDKQVVGHAAFSPAFPSNGATDWYALGPIAVEPKLQRQGVGRAMIKQGLAELKTLGAQGCVVLGDTNYYPRHGFMPAPQNAPHGEPPEHFMALPFHDQTIDFTIGFHPAFKS